MSCAKHPPATVEISNGEYGYEAPCLICAFNDKCSDLEKAQARIADLEFQHKVVAQNAAETLAGREDARAALERERGANIGIGQGIIAAEAEIKTLRGALENAIEGMKDMRSYVDAYFAEKWDHDGYIQRAEAALAKTSSVLGKPESEPLPRCCNRHRDCAVAEEKAKAEGKPERYGPGTPRLDHCHDEGCEDCFGC